MAGGLLDMSLEQESAALGGEINEAEYGSKKWQQERVQREQARNAPIQLVAFLSGQATGGKVKDPTQGSDINKDEQQVKGTDSGIVSPTDPRVTNQSYSGGSGTGLPEDSDTGQDNGMGSLFGFAGKNIIGGFLGQSGGGGGAMGASGGAGASAASSMGPPD